MNGLRLQFARDIVTLTYIQVSILIIAVLI